MREHSDRTLALSAGLIGLAALAISAYQAYIMREQQRASVWPRVELLVNNGDGAFSLTMSNAGIGPALIQDAEVTVDGQPKRTWTEVLAAFGAGGSLAQGKIGDRVLTPGQTQAIFTPTDPAAIAAMNGSGGASVQIRICYCSIYDECWAATRKLEANARLTHVAVKSCGVDEARRFAGH